MESSWAGLEAVFYAADSQARASAGPNIITSTGDGFLSLLSVAYPYVNVRPRRGEFVRSAPVLESVDNWLLKELRVDAAMNRGMLHAFLWGKGVMKIGYDSEYGYDPQRDIGGSEPLGMTLTQFDKKGNLIENGVVDPGMPWVKSVSPHDIIVPWGTVDLEDAGWIAHRVIRHVDDIKSDPKYRNHRDLRPSISHEDYVKSYQTTQHLHIIGVSSMNHGGRGKAEYCELFEIHSRRTKRIVVIATGHSRVLRDVVDELQIDGLPFVDLSFTPRARTFWTTPDAYYLKQAQAEMDDISLQASIQRRITKMKFLYGEDALDEAELDKMISAEGSIGVKVKSGVPLNEAVLPTNNVNQASLYQDEEIILRNARDVVGLSRNQRGEFESGRRSAYEAKTVNRGAMSRMGRRQKQVRLAYENVIRKINQIIFSFWTQKRVVEFVGEEGGREWMEYSGSQLKGEYQYEVVFSDEILPTESQERNESLQLYAQLVQDPNLDQNSLREFFSSKHNDPGFKKLFKGGVQNANV